MRIVGFVVLGSAVLSFCGTLFMRDIWPTDDAIVSGKESPRIQIAVQERHVGEVPVRASGAALHQAGDLQSTRAEPSHVALDAVTVSYEVHSVACGSSSDMFWRTRPKRNPAHIIAKPLMTCL